MPDSDPQSRRKRVQVLCLTYGEPPGADLAAQFRYSLSILRRLTLRVAKIPRLILPLIALRRGLSRRAKFRKAGFASPLEDISRRQIQSLQQALADAKPDTDFRAQLAFEFREPYVWTVLESLMADPPDELVVLPLYIARSTFTTGLSRTDLAAFNARTGPNPLPAPKFVEGVAADPRLAPLMAEFILDQCQAAGWDAEKRAQAVLILGAHGTVVHPPPGIENGLDETRNLAEAVCRELENQFAAASIGWMNHGRYGGEWTKPEVRDVARDAQAQGLRRAVFFPAGFMADSAETLIDGPDQLAESQWDDVLHLPSLNDDPTFIHFLRDRIIQRLAVEAEPWDAL